MNATEHALLLVDLAKVVAVRHARAAAKRSDRMAVRALARLDAEVSLWKYYLLTERREPLSEAMVAKLDDAVAACGGLGEPEASILQQLANALRALLASKRPAEGRAPAAKRTRRVPD